MTHPTNTITLSQATPTAAQPLTQWQQLLQQTIIQSHLGQVMILPRWAEVSQPWKVS